MVCRVARQSVAAAGFQERTVSCRPCAKGIGPVTGPRSPRWKPGSMMHANPRPRAAVPLAGRRPLGINPALRAWHSHKKPRVATREHDPREPAASCRGSLGGPPPAWNQPGPPGLALTQNAPGGNPGTPGMKTTLPSMPDDGTQFPGSNPHCMAPGKACDPESPGFRRGRLVPFARVTLRARLGNAHHQNVRPWAWIVDSVRHGSRKCGYRRS